MNQKSANLMLKLFVERSRDENTGEHKRTPQLRSGCIRGTTHKMFVERSREMSTADEQLFSLYLYNSKRNPGIDWESLIKWG